MYIVKIIFLICILFLFLYTKTTVTNDHENIINTLYRQTARWAVASQQDNNELIKVLHANYATGYLWAIKDIISTEEFKAITGIDFLEFEHKITKIQDEATKKLISKCKVFTDLENGELLKAIYNRSDN